MYVCEYILICMHTCILKGWYSESADPTQAHARMFITQFGEFFPHASICVTQCSGAFPHAFLSTLCDRFAKLDVHIFFMQIMSNGSLYYAQTHTHTHMYIYMHTYIRMHTYADIYTRTYIHTYIHTYWHKIATICTS